MEFFSFLISAGGLLISIYAAYTAQNAKSAIDRTVRKVNAQSDISEISDIIGKLSDAKTAASVWRPGAVEKSQIGRDCLADLQIVRDAEDALAVWAPAELDEVSKNVLETGRQNLKDYCEQIANPDINENNWEGVVVTTQSLIRFLREHSRVLENSQLISMT